METNKSLFIETHTTSDQDGINLAFIKSLNIQVFPCGRRRSIVDLNKTDGKTEEYYIPFDPEARLNTEANNRKHSGLGGLTQTYLNKWTADTLSLVLAGYVFDIKLGDNTGAGDIGSRISEVLKNTDKARIYANIVIEEIPLFSSDTGLNYNTSVLRNQTNTEDPATSLDILSDNADHTRTDSYYFSGLSFSTSPITGQADTRSAEDKVVKEVKEDEETGQEYTITTRRQLVSLCILEKNGNTWQIHEPARLPNIEHGDTENSVKLGDVNVDSIKHGGDNLVKLKAADITPNEQQEDKKVFQLQFTSTSKSKKP